MATYSSNRLIMRKVEIDIFCRLIGDIWIFFFTDMFIEKFRIKSCLKIFIRWVYHERFIHHVWNKMGLFHVEYDKTKTGLCTKQRHSSVWASVQSDQSLCCASELEKTRVASYPWSTHRSILSDWVDVQADLNLRWVQSFCHVLCVIWYRMKTPLKKNCVYAEFPRFRNKIYNIFEWYPTKVSTMLLSIIRHTIQYDQDTTYSAEKSVLRHAIQNSFWPLYRFLWK